MKRDKLRRTGNGRPTSQVEDGAANNDFYETDLERFSAAHYKQRGRIWRKFNRGDWWIAVGVYLILSSVAFVVM